MKISKLAMQEFKEENLKLFEDHTESNCPFFCHDGVLRKVKTPPHPTFEWLGLKWTTRDAKWSNGGYCLVIEAKNVQGYDIGIALTMAGTGDYASQVRPPKLMWSARDFYECLVSNIHRIGRRDSTGCYHAVQI